jgi:hypothetical protein
MLFFAGAVVLALVVADLMELPNRRQMRRLL